MSPIEAVEKSAANAEGVTGVFEMIVQATGTDQKKVFLNSQDDYRDRRNLSVVLSQTITMAMLKRDGIEPIVDLKGKKIRVYGTARAVKVWFYVGGIRTKDYYYQTHIELSDAEHLAIVK